MEKPYEHFLSPVRGWSGFCNGGFAIAFLHILNLQRFPMQELYIAVA